MIFSNSVWGYVFWILVGLAAICLIGSIITCIMSCCPCHDDEEAEVSGCCVCCVNADHLQNESPGSGGRRQFVYTEIISDEPSLGSSGSADHSQSLSSLYNSIQASTPDSSSSRPMDSLRNNRYLADCKSIKYKRNTRWIFGRSRRCRNDLCPICIEEYSTGDSLVLCPCRHAYHKKCLETWLKVKNRCPLCKRPVCKRPSQSERSPLLYNVWVR